VVELRPAHLGSGLDDLPMPTVIVVDASGTIRWIDVHPDHTTRTEPQQILAAVDAVVYAD
jgi:alkyl hydroperoxide reductase subunit AhpC